MAINSNHILLCAVILSFCSCSKPQESYSFILSDPIKSDSGMVFIFDVPLNDTGLVYSTNISCRYNSRKIVDTCIRFDIQALSPSGKLYGEEVCFPLGVKSDLIKVGKSNRAIITIEWPYRDNIRVPIDTGIWKITIRPADQALSKGLYGVGFAYHGQHLSELNNERKR